MTRVLFKNIQEFVATKGFQINKHTNKKAKHYTATIKDGSNVDLYYAGKMSEMLAEINEIGFENFVGRCSFSNSAVAAKKASKAEKLALDEKITDVALKLMRIGFDRKSTEFQELRAELYALKNKRHEINGTKQRSTKADSADKDATEKPKKRTVRKITKRKAS